MDFYSSGGFCKLREIIHNSYTKDVSCAVLVLAFGFGILLHKKKWILLENCNPWKSKDDAGALVWCLSDGMMKMTIFNPKLLCAVNVTVTCLKLNIMVLQTW